MKPPAKPAAKPFPIPIVADASMFGPGSQPEDEALDYLVMPQGMDTFRPPVLPEPEDLAGHAGAHAVLGAVLAAVAAHREAAAAMPVALDAAANRRVGLQGLSAEDLKLVNQVLGEGEVSAQVVDAQEPVRIQESVFAGVWRVIETRADGRVQDSIEIGPIPAVLLAAARADAAHAAPPPAAVPPGVMNAPSLLMELQDQRKTWRDGQPAHVVNLTLLPLSADDIGFMDHQLGTGRVLILSRGYGNCRITNACVPHTWRVVYYNSADAVILNAVEVARVPEVACAAPEDLADTEERLREVLAWVDAERSERTERAA